MRVKRRRWGAGLWIASLFGLACSGPTDRIATEDLGDAELRVVVARSGAQAEARALGKDVPYRFELEPLSDIFDRGDALRVWVLGYRVEDIAGAFPELAGRGAADVLGRLAPGLGPAGPGRYAAPEPRAVLFAQIEQGTSADVAYEARAWDQSESEVGLHFALVGDIACPPVGAVIRAFARDDPGRVCIYTRNTSCEWARTGGDACANQARIFGDEGTILQQPSGALSVGNLSCAAVPARGEGPERGESAAWNCAGRLVAAQEQPINPDGTPWAPTRGPTIDDPDAAQPAQWVPASPGVFLAFERDQDVHLRRITVAGGEATYQTLQHPVVDSPLQGQRRATSDDGLTVRVVGGDFEENVGTSALQCFRRADRDGRPLEWAAVDGHPAPDRLLLAGPALTPFTDSLDWQVLGDPGQRFDNSPEVTTIALPSDTDGLGRLSLRGNSNPVQLILHGRARTFALPKVTRFRGEHRYFSCAEEIPQPANTAGPIIAGPSGFYAMMADGILPLDDDGQPGSLLSNEGETFSRTWTLTRTETRSGQERVVVYREGVAHVFDPVRATHYRHQVDGRIAAVLPGPDLAYKPTGEDFVLARAIVNEAVISETIRYVVPAFDEQSPVPFTVGPVSFHGAGTGATIGFASGPLAGLLDLDTGRSAAVPVGVGAAVQALFEDESGGETWAAVSTDAGRLELVRWPPR